MLDFVYESLSVRVVFGAGRAASLGDELGRLGLRRALLLCTPGRRPQAEAAAARIGAAAAAIFDRAEMHVPAANVREVRRATDEAAADCCIAIGGGSATGLAKAMAHEAGLPYVALPTTYSGSEMTPIWGRTEAGIKRTGRDPRVLPRVVIYDPELTLGLPPAVSAASGMNAIAHCMEALYARNASPITSMMAEEGIRTLAAALPAVTARPGDLAARGEALYGACLAGASLATVEMGLHHKLAHILGGTFNLPHAPTHAVLLPHVAAFNAAAASAAFARLARALGGGPAPGALHDLATRIGAPLALADLGMEAADLDRAAEAASQSPYPNPRPVSREGVRRVLDDAYHGRPPPAPAADPE